QSLLRFVNWCETTHFRLRILFTPWGEALVRKHYRDAFVRISHVQNVIELGIQTNLSRDPTWLEKADRESVSLWCTYHPSQVSRARFLRRLERLLQMRIRFSVGMVALREDLAEVREMHRLLGQLERNSGQPIHFWLNAYDERPPSYYGPQEVDILTAIDPHFAFNLQPTPSLGARCRAGIGAVSVDARGDARPCH
ncbi:MAG: radical SAM protein, partial [Xanthomonadales bacterium]|nr:radical SAM protein [Xanthomonadales bacterium]